MKIKLTEAGIDDLKKIENRITQIIDSKPNMKIEDEQ